jgi:hypothetical protein
MKYIIICAIAIPVVLVVWAGAVRLIKEIIKSK